MTENTMPDGGRFLPLTGCDINVCLLTFYQLVRSLLYHALRISHQGEHPFHGKVNTFGGIVNLT